MKECEWRVGIPFNIPQRWNCDEICRAKLHNEQMYTRTHVRIPAIKCSNVTRTVVCTKAFFRFSLSVISDQTVTSHFCRNLDRQKKTDGEELIQ
uniref:Uncharacterized protein n=1 Tax=Dracunculus medinensis TaxID=318479 RepID=A0A0N4UIA7_DRAME